MQEVIAFFFSFDSGNKIGATVNVAILALLVAGIRSFLSAARRLKKERSGLEAFRSLPTPSTTASAVLHATHTTAGGSSLVGRRVALLNDLLRVGADPDVGTMAAVARADLERDGAFARWAAGTAILMGLAGTLVGLSQAVLSAMPMIRDIVNTDEAIKAVTDTFSGLGTAFSTTLMGIFASIVLGILNMMLRRSQTAYMSQLEQVSILKIYPYFRTSPAQAMVQAAQMLTKLEQQLATSMADIIGQLRTQGLALTKMVDDSVTQLVVEVSSAGKGLKQSLSDLSQELRDRGHAITGMVDKSFTILTEELRDGTGALQKRLEETHSAMQRLIGDPDSDALSIAESLKALQNAVGAIQTSAERLTQMAPILEEAIAKQIDRQSRDLHDTMHSYTGRIADSVKRQDELQNSGFKRIEAGLSAFGETTVDVLKRHDADLMKAVREELKALADSLKDSLTGVQSLAIAAKALEASSNRLGSAGEAEERVANRINDATKDLVTSLNKVVTTLNTVSSRFESRGGVTLPPHAVMPGAARNPVDGNRATGAATAGSAKSATGSWFSRLFGK